LLGAFYFDLDKIALKRYGQFLDEKNRRIRRVVQASTRGKTCCADDYADHIGRIGLSVSEPHGRRCCPTRAAARAVGDVLRGPPENLLPGRFSRTTCRLMPVAGAVGYGERAAERHFDRARAKH